MLTVFKLVEEQWFLITSMVCLVVISYIQYILRKGSGPQTISWYHLLMPVICLGILVYVVLTRSSLQEYVPSLVLSGVILVPMVEEIGKSLHAGAHAHHHKRILITGVYIAL